MGGAWSSPEPVLGTTLVLFILKGSFEEITTFKSRENIVTSWEN